MTIIYNAPYQSKYNLIEYVFSLLRKQIQKILINILNYNINMAHDHYRIFAKIEGHGGIIVTKKPSKLGGLVGQVGFTPTPNFHIHRSGIVMCGTLYSEIPNNNLTDYCTRLI